MKKELEQLIHQASDIIEKMSEYIKEGEFQVLNGSFSVKFDKKFSNAVEDDEYNQTK